MSVSQFVQKRGSVFYFRRAIPIKFQGALDRRELIRSLKTSSRKLARSRSWRLYFQTEAIFRSIEDVPMVDTRQVKALARQFYDAELDADDATRFEVAPVYCADDISKEIARLQEVEREARQSLARNELYLAEHQAEKLADQHRMTLDETGLMRLSHAVLRAQCEVARALQARLSGDFTYQPDDPLLQAPASTASHEATANIFEPHVQILFSDAAQKFSEKREVRGTWSQQTSRQARKTYQLFVSCCGDRMVGSYARHDAKRFKELLADLPYDYGKSVQYSDMTIEEIAIRHQKSGGRSLSPRTIQRHLHALSTLWDDLNEQEAVGENIFKGFKLPASKKARDQRSQWAPSDLKSLFASPIWAGCKNIHRRKEPGRAIIRDAYFWLPLIAIYSGMRLEEIAQLTVRDIEEKDSIHFFNIGGTESAKLKSASALRKVPIHPELVRMGLLDYRNEVAERGHSQLWPKLKPGGADNRYGHAFSKWFTRYRRDVGVYREKMDFHSFRHSATTALARADVPEPIIDELTGHVRMGETARYTKGYALKQLALAIAKIDYGLEFTHLYVR